MAYLIGLLGLVFSFHAFKMKVLVQVVKEKSRLSAGSLALGTTPVDTRLVTCCTYVAWKLGSHGQVSTEAEQHPPTLADQQSVETPRHYATSRRHVMTARHDAT